mmetsp:Transcript_104426/g.156401  ORF Transcript_104426/g.156401 Transcript_104426/m.156401 type:complete len:148 (-) Transcript_104426:468-911(-)
MKALFGYVLLHSFHEWAGKHGHSVCTTHREVENRQEKGSVVVVSHTVVEPYTMMVKSKNAPITFAAMPTSRRSCDVAFLTNCPFHRRKVSNTGNILNIECVVFIYSFLFFRHIQARIEATTPPASVNRKPFLLPNFRSITIIWALPG